MERPPIHHRPCHFDHTLVKRLEIEREIAHGPEKFPHVVARCPDCDASMAYRGIGRLRSGPLVYHFECVHSHREVHSVSIIIGEDAPSNTSP
jgi:hypothetical protein